MDQLIHDTLKFLKQEAKRQDAILVTPEEFEYFSPRKKALSEKKQVHEAIDPEMRQLVAKELPDIALTSKIPTDSEARKRSNLWKEGQLTAKVLVLSLKEKAESLQLLQNMTKAINSLASPAHLIEIDQLERESGWELALGSPQLRLVLAPPIQEWKSLSLIRFYKETPSSKECFLNDIPLILMQPTTTYLKNPDLKRELWKTLSLRLSTST